MADETFDLTLRVKRVLMRTEARLPTRAEPGAAGLDLYAAEDVTLPPLSTSLVPLGIATEFSPGWFGQIRERSGLASAGIAVGGGVIDPSYRGEWWAVLRNLTGAPYLVGAGSRVAQVTFHRRPAVEVVEVGSLSETARGGNGFGSSGR